MKKGLRYRGHRHYRKTSQGFGKKKPFLETSFYNE